MDKISKKELLAQTGISYGQLYRWKREGLIPEEWFIKQSAFTGQETFFPKDQIMERVAFILREKDAHSLEELAGMLSADGGDLRMSAAELENMQLFSSQARQAMGAMDGRGEYTLWETALLTAAARAAAECGIPEKDLACFFERSLSLKQTGAEGTFLVFSMGGEYYCAVACHQERICFDRDTRIAASFPIEEEMRRIRQKLREQREKGEER